MLPNGTELIPRAYLQYSLDVVWLHSLSSTYWTQAEQQAVVSLPSFCENKAGRDGYLEFEIATLLHEAGPHFNLKI